MKLFLAPLQGMTLAYYRNLYSEIFGGFDEYWAPFIATSDNRNSSFSLFKDLLPELNNDNINVIPQLLSNSGANFRNFASGIVDMGYKEINWNIGCPYPMVAKKKRGSGILPYPDLIKEFLDEVCLDDSYDLTVKMRLGFNNLDEGIKVVELLNDYPLKGVTIHARTGLQMYKGVVDLDSFEILNSLCKHEVTYNGDIFSNDDFIKIQKRFPTINNFMIGRGAIQDPFLPSTIKGIVTPNDEKIRKIKLFHDSAYDHYKSILSGDQHLLAKMKELWMYLHINIDPSGKNFKKIKKTTTSSAYLRIVEDIFNSPITFK